MAKRIDPQTLPERAGTFYPPPYDRPCRARYRRALGDAAGLGQFGINLTRLPPGGWSSQRHWHAKADEFVYVVAGELMLVTDAGEEVLRAGDCAGFPGGDGNGHHLQNRSDRDALYLEIGSRVAGDSALYPDIDLVLPPEGKPALYTHRDGAPYEGLKRRLPGDPG